MPDPTSNSTGHISDGRYCIPDDPTILLLLAISSVTLRAHAKTIAVSATIVRVPAMTHALRVKLLTVLTSLLPLHL